MTDNFPKYKRAKTPQFWRAQTASSVIKSTHTHTHTIFKLLKLKTRSNSKKMLFFGAV